MIVVESLHQRKLIGALDSGEDLVDELTRICELQKLQSGDFTLSGRIRAVELVRFDDGEYVDIPLADGEFELVQLNGNVARMGQQVVLRLEALLAGWGPAGQQLIFGQIRAAEIVDVEFSLVAHDDVAAKRRLDADSGTLKLASVEKTEQAQAAPARPRTRTPERIAEPKLGAPAAKPEAVKAAPAPAPSPTPEPEPVEPSTTGEAVSGLSWAEAMKASEDIKPASKADKVKAMKARKRAPADDLDEAEEEEDDKALLSPGDILDHPKLGKCRVIKVEDEDYAHIRLKRGQIRKLALQVCEVTYVGEEDGRNLFKIRIKR